MSRLDRLATLIETGSTPFIRNTAADQLSDLAKQHPEDILNLLSRVYPFLLNKKWETRTTAARAMGGIISLASQWDPNSETEDEPKVKEIKEEEEDPLNPNLGDNFETRLVTLDAFNLQDILNSGIVLLASSGSEYNTTSNGSSNKRRRSEFVTQLGLGKPKSPVKPVVKVKREDSTGLLDGDSPSSSSAPSSSPSPTRSTPPHMSARMRALARRRAKLARSHSHRGEHIDLRKSSVSRELSQDGSNPKTVDSKPEYSVTTQSSSSKIVVENKPKVASLLDEQSKCSRYAWQFQGLYELLVDNLFSDLWEVRHGCAMGLRELIKYQASGAGRVKGKSQHENDYRNERTLEDLCVRVITLLAVDRFGDYVSDTVVAPVRENAGQVLAALLLHLPDSTVIKAFYTLMTLIDQDFSGAEKRPQYWEAKHGGILGLKYFVSVRRDLLLSNPDILKKTFSVALSCLQDAGDDDVQSMAAATLIPITSEFVKLVPDMVFQILQAIWDSLSDTRDDLSASTGSIMDLLAKLCLHKEVLLKMKEFAKNDEQYKFKYLVPKLYPFLRHSITDVRKSVLKTLYAFLQIEDDSTKDWITGKVFRLIFQNLLLEQNPDVAEWSNKVYQRLLKEVEKGGHGTMDELFHDNWEPLLELLVTPIGIARFNYSMNTSCILRPSGNTLATSDIKLTGFNVSENQHKEHHHGHKRKCPSTDTSESKIGIPDSEYDLHVDIDAPIINGDLTLVSRDVLVKTRLAAASALGETLARYQTDDELSKVCKKMHGYLKDPFFTSQLFTSIVVEEYCKACKGLGKEPSSIVKDVFVSSFMDTLKDPSLLGSFREFVPTLKGLRTRCLQLFDVFREVGHVSNSKLPTLPVVVEGERDAGPDAFNIGLAEKVVGEWYKKIFGSMSALYRISSVQALGDAKYGINVAIDEAKAAKSSRTVSILSSFAAGYVELAGVPKKLNPVIRAVIDSIKKEDSVDLQSRSAQFAASMISLLHENGRIGASDKMVKNLCSFLCVDTSEVPEFVPNKGYTDVVLSLKKEDNKIDSGELSTTNIEIHLAKIKRRGSKEALEYLLENYKADLFVKIPKIKSIMLDALYIFGKGEDYEPSDAEGQSAIDSLELIRSLVGKLDKSLYSEIFNKAHLVLSALESKYSVFRYSASKCFSSLCCTSPSDGFQLLVKSILPMLNDAGDVRKRQGAIETIYHITNLMGTDILPYVIFLIVPVMGRMSDSDKCVRVLATTTFASIIKLVPLEAGIADPPDMPESLLKGREREREFIKQMMDPTKIEPFKLPVTIQATLRKYQQEGVNWLAFLNRYHLHGILCDDMGLGKTLQTICIMASDHHMRREKFKKTNAPEDKPLCSVVVCPPSLVGHWEAEFAQYAPFMSVLIYAGPPAARHQLRPNIFKHDVIVTSYDVVRNDVEFITKANYNYCVLDEGHIIRNANSRLTKAVKRIHAEHRLILTGTPIQNNVLELWSLFDFLMPGFLGTEKSFHDKFVKPIASSRTNKGSKEQEAGALALETLHKQVLPFMLRRLKEDVLSDLPPKIIQDYYCELSSLQKQLYYDFTSKQKGEVKKDLSNSDKHGKRHIFQVLQYMRKLCNSPALVVTPKHPQYKEVMAYLDKYHMDIRDIHYSPKLVALKNLLKECGIGLTSPPQVSSGGNSNNSALLEGNVISQHRALIFCQMRDMLDIVENDLLKKNMPSVTYMRMDGTTDPRYRQKIVSKFNSDPSIDVLLLTTKVGGLGLNLTGADTVIFVEHDWNPMNDLQAMDRAHRIGQKKVVNVYRLITKDTLEEKIMGLQKFKLNIANTVVNQQNAGLSSMNSGQLLDLFGTDATNATANDNEVSEIDTDEDEDNVKNVKKKDGSKKELPNEVGLSGKAGKAVQSLGKLWDQSQYEEEYNLDSFLKTLK